MSGVFGVVGSGEPGQFAALLERMAAAMRHFSWYDVDTTCDERRGVALGRIGIGLFNSEAQPVRSEDGQLAVCFRGELADTAALRHQLILAGCPPRDHTDSELTLRLYEHFGETFVQHMAGTFVAAIWDGRRGRLLLVNDRFGLFPTYYAHHRRRFLFAPEMKGILCDSHFTKELDRTAVAEYMRFQYPLGDKTFFVGLKLLPNASRLTYDVDADRVHVDSYWDVNALPQLPDSLTLDEAAEEAGGLLRRAVQRSAAGPYRIGLYLSGGVDSRAVLGFLRHQVAPLTTITYGQPACRDLVYAERLARIAGTQHHQIPLLDGAWVRQFVDRHLELTEGMSSWIHSHGISTLDQARAWIDVNITGHGGGDRACDWPTTLLHISDDAAFHVHAFDALVRRATWPGLDEAEERLLFNTPFSTPLRGVAFESLRTEIAALVRCAPPRRALALSVANADRRLFAGYVTFGRSHVEQRAPFCDYAYADFVLAVPEALLCGRRLRRAILQRAMPDLARVRCDHDNLPAIRSEALRFVAKVAERSRAFVNRRFRVFAEYAPLNCDYEGWLRGELRPWAEELLLGPRTRSRELFDMAFVESLWRRHQSGREPNFIGKLAPLMTLEMVLRRFWD